MAGPALFWRPSRRLPQAALRACWWIALVATPLAAVLHQATAFDDLGGGAGTPVPGPGLVDAVPLVAFAWLTLVWLWAPPDGRPLPGPGRRLAAVAVTAALSTLLVTVVGVLLGQPWWGALAGGLGGVVHGATTLVLHRWRTGDDDLVPHRPRDLVSLGTAAVAGAVVAAPLAAWPALLPGLTLADLGPTVLAGAVLGASYVFVGGACLLLLVQRHPSDEEPARLGDVYVMLLVTAAAIAAVLAFPEVPLTWIVLLPAVWAGMTLGPWAAAGFSLVATAAVSLAQGLPVATGGLTPDQLPEMVVVDTVMTAFVLVVLLLAVVRDQQAHLAGEVVRRRQEALDQAGLLGTVFESISEALVLMDTHGTVQLSNAAAAGVLGEQRLESEPGRWLRRLASSPSFTYTFHRDGTDDGARVLAVQLARVQYAGSDSVVAIVRDVTSEQRRIDELASFAAVAAHDLKSPLTAVGGWLEVAEDMVGADDVRVREALGHGLAATQRMTREIDDWLTYNVAREGTLRLEQVALQPLVESLAASHPTARFTLEAPDTVRADPTLLQHLLANLLGNAVKYAHPGREAVVTVRSGDHPTGWVQVEVVDEGIGIPAGEELAVFEPFRRASTVTDAYEGSGMGLALCKRIVRRHGGTITARRNDGPGTTVTVVLPRGSAG